MGAASKQNTSLSVFFKTHTHCSDALLPAKQVCDFGEPIAHVAVAALGPVAEQKDEIDFSLHERVLCMTLLLSKLV